MAKLNPKEVLRLVRLKASHRLAWQDTLKILTGLEARSVLLEKLSAEGEEDIIAKFLEEIELSFEFFEEELRRIPEKGPAILVCNHPLSGLDALILIQLLKEKRPDLKIIGSRLKKNVEALSDYWDFELPKGALSEIGIGDLTSQEGLVAVFPSAKVSSHFDVSRRQMRDGTWDLKILEEVLKAAVPVIPVYFKANRNLAYQVLRRLVPAVDEIRVPVELKRIKSKPVIVRFGRTIYPKEIAAFSDTESFSKFLRSKVYLLGNALRPSFKLFAQSRPEREEAIIDPVDPELIQSEINALALSGAEVSERRNYKCYLAEADEIPSILREIGRLREITFRAIGEGSNLALDLDSFDQHYHHLVLWCEEEQCIAGAYRLAIGPDVYAAYSHKGFYLNTLFKFSDRVKPMLGESLEMGRAFVVPNHQNKPMPLFVMWEGIRALMRDRQDLKYIMGCASISNNFSPFGKALMVAYLLKNFGDAHLATEIKPRKAFKPKLNKEGREIVMNSSAEDLVKFDRKIDEIEPGDLRMPPLIKKYLQQNALMVCFNVDPLFNNSLDGFMYIHRQDLEL